MLLLALPHSALAFMPPPEGWRFDGSIAFTRTTACALDAGSVRCWGGEESDGIQSKVVLNLNSPAALCSGGSSGSYHTCALSASGDVQCWGQNGFGQLGYGDTVSRPPPYGDQVLPMVDLGADRKARQVSCGMYHTCALLEDGAVKCWGDNQYTQVLATSCCTPARNKIGDEPDEIRDSLPVPLSENTVGNVAVACGERATCVLTADYQVKCWGFKTTSTDQAVCDSAVADGYGTHHTNPGYEDYCDVLIPGACNPAGESCSPLAFVYLWGFGFLLSSEPRTE